MDYFIDTLTELNKNLTGAIGAIAAIGALTMGIVEFFKTTLGFRKRFLEHHINDWLQPKRAEDMAGLVFPGNRDAFFSQPIDECMDRVRASLPAALDYPKSFAALLRKLVSAKGVPDSDDLCDEIGILTQGTSGKGKTPSDAEDVMRIKRRLLDRCRSAVTAKQVELEGRWLNRMRAASFVVSFLMILALTQFRGSSLFYAVFGALLAPVARDLVAAIQRARSP